MCTVLCVLPLHLHHAAKLHGVAIFYKAKEEENPVFRNDPLLNQESHAKVAVLGSRCNFDS